LTTSKKANIAMELVVIFLVIAFLAVCVPSVYFMSSAYNETIHAMYGDNVTRNHELLDLAETQATNNYNLWDYTIIFFLFALWSVSIYFAFQINTHPILFWVTMISLVFMVFVAASLSNIWIEMVDDEAFTFIPQSFPITHYVLTWWPIIIAMLGTSLAIAFFARRF